MKIETLFEEQLNEHLQKVDGKWALVSKTTGRPLRYYKGSGKPSQAWVSKMEQEIHAFESLSEGIEFKKDKLPNGKEIIRFHDEVGGDGFLTINGDTANIVDWDSVPDGKRYGPDEAQFKNRGFAVQTIQAIKNQLGIDKVRVSLPSQEAVASLNKMIQKGILIPDEDSRMGPSDSPHFTTFTIA